MNKINMLCTSRVPSSSSLTFLHFLYKVIGLGEMFVALSHVDIQWPFLGSKFLCCYLHLTGIGIKDLLQLPVYCQNSHSYFGSL